MHPVCQAGVGFACGLPALAEVANEKRLTFGLVSLLNATIGRRTT
jgi:hypothetical protein